jgi:hypothetical protein
MARVAGGGGASLGGGGGAAAGGDAAGGGAPSTGGRLLDWTGAGEGAGVAADAEVCAGVWGLG